MGERGRGVKDGLEGTRVIVNSRSARRNATAGGPIDVVWFGDMAEK